MIINSGLVKLEWDSKFWLIDIYEINRNIVNSGIDFVIPKIQSKFIIQELVAVDDVVYINKLEDIGFRFVENKITLVKSIDVSSNYENSNILEVAKIEEIDAYKNEFYDLFGTITRFSIFSKSSINDFYYEWVRKSIMGNLDDGVYGYYEDGILAGIISYKIVNKVLKIGIVAVFKKYQGRKIVQCLLQYIEQFASDKGCHVICVSTQGKNNRAVNAYIGAGYKISEIKNWYYYYSGGWI